MPGQNAMHGTKESSVREEDDVGGHTLAVQSGTSEDTTGSVTPSGHLTETSGKEVSEGDKTETKSSASEMPADLREIIDLLPEEAREALCNHEEVTQLVEVVMDYGRLPLGRFPSGDVVLSSTKITLESLKAVEEEVGQFGKGNRAGICGTLHRISCLRNRADKIIGMTCRVGRDIPDGARLLEDILEEGKSILVVGVPGVGKTTAIRCMCKFLSDVKGKRVVVVDTSNEIGGDGDIPHESIGSSRRMQVPMTRSQHHVMVEAVQNHMPEVIVIDEIGAAEECEAARTISRRAIQLIASAHGNTLGDVLRDPILQDLLGGVQTVIRSDALVRETGLEKIGMGRKWAPSFDVLVEMNDRSMFRIVHDLRNAVDMSLKNEKPYSELRQGYNVVAGGSMQQYGRGQAQDFSADMSHEEWADPGLNVIQDSWEPDPRMAASAPWGTRTSWQPEWKTSEPTPEAHATEVVKDSWEDSPGDTDQSVHISHLYGKAESSKESIVAKQLGAGGLQAEVSSMSEREKSTNTKTPNVSQAAKASMKPATKSPAVPKPKKKATIDTKAKKKKAAKNNNSQKHQTTKSKEVPESKADKCKEEIKRILASTEYVDTLQVPPDAFLICFPCLLNKVHDGMSADQIREQFNKLMAKIQKTVCVSSAGELGTTARNRLQEAYKQVMDSSEESSPSQDIAEVISSTSLHDILQVEDGVTKKELDEVYEEWKEEFPAWKGIPNSNIAKKKLAAAYAKLRPKLP